MASHNWLCAVSTNYHHDACNQMPISISMDCKLLMCFKLLAYGISANAFQEHFQIGERTANYCGNCLVESICHSAKLTRVYLRAWSSSTVKQIFAMHKEVHGNGRIVGSFDCTHCTWKKLPKSIQMHLYQWQDRTPNHHPRGCGGF